MKAVLCKEYGPPEKLVYEDTTRPDVGPTDVRIRVRAAGVNFPDLLIIENKYQFKPPLPFAPGGEVAGDVIEVGAEVTDFSRGDRVIGMCGWNGFAEEVVISRDRVVRMPDGMPYEVGTVLPTTYGTTVHALVQRGRLRAGEWLLVHGATGGVGSSAVEVGKNLGARIVATGGDDRKLARLAELYGVEHLVNYRTNPDWKETVKAITDGGADVIYDPVGGDVFEQSLRCIAWAGRLLVIGFAGGTIPSAKANLILLKGCAVVGVFWGGFAAREPETNRRNFALLFDWWKEGKLKPAISHRFPLAKAAEALGALARREVVGKAVLEVG
ncbi:MAG: NADPH:quinone oxidoreductase family protein [Deltaproteobacteria bacterium]|nr:MAG: NADPH:quinone oxidoreductase family protein [Deltaproteobacteria bacterium]